MQVEQDLAADVVCATAEGERGGEVAIARRRVYPCAEPDGVDPPRGEELLDGGGAPLVGEPASCGLELQGERQVRAADPLGELRRGGAGELPEAATGLNASGIAEINWRRESISHSPGK